MRQWLVHPVSRGHIMRAHGHISLPERASNGEIVSAMIQAGLAESGEWIVEREGSFIYMARPGKGTRFQLERVRENPISSGQTVALIGLGVVLVGAIGYLVYRSQSSPSPTASGGGAPLPGSQTGYGTYMGPGGSSSDGLPSASSSGNDYEAAAGPDAQLVPTGGA